MTLEPHPEIDGAQSDPQDVTNLAQANQQLRATVSKLQRQLAAAALHSDQLVRQQAVIRRQREQLQAIEDSLGGRGQRVLNALLGQIAPPNTLRGHMRETLERRSRRQLERIVRFTQVWEWADLSTAVAGLLPSRLRPGRRFVPASVIVRPPVALSSATVDLIICVHNALPDVQRCLSAVVRYTRWPCQLILVDDASEAECANYLATFAREQGALLIRNDSAQGYTRAANLGLRRSTADFVVMLNSDTIPTPDWLDRLLACAESDPKIGLAGPLSNTASWQSIPQVFGPGGDWAKNEQPSGISAADMASTLAWSSARLYPPVPFLNGFCLLIRRAVLSSVGLFDDENFGEGYGEEDDYCLRARAKGWKLAVADDAYVYHAQSSSYSDERRIQLSERAQERLAAKHGQAIIGRDVGKVQRDRVLEGLRARARVMAWREQLRAEGRARWEGKRILCLLPVRGTGGGANVILQEAEAMRWMGVDVTVVSLAELEPEFKRGYPNLSLPVHYLDDPRELAALAQRFDGVLATQNMSVEWMAWPDQRGCPVRGYYVQDFEPWFFPDGSVDQVRALRSYTLLPDLVCVTKTEWTRATVLQQTGAECVVVGPSVDVDLHRPRPRRDGDWPERAVRIAAMIRPESPRRQPAFTMQALRAIERQFGRQVEVILFGCPTRAPGFQALPRDFRWHNAGVLNRSQMAFLLNEVDIFVDFSSFQAMGLTALEAMACGVAVVVPQAGGAGSYAVTGKNSLVIDASSPAAAQQALATLVTQHELRLELQRMAIRDSVSYFPERAAVRVLAALFRTDKA